jgi:hypothetical protein
MIAFVKSTHSRQTNGWQEEFLLMLPRIAKYAHRAFRNLRREAKEDAVCEVVARCMCDYRRLHQRKETHRAFASTLVRYAVAGYYRGRRVGAAQCSRDIYHRRSRGGKFSDLFRDSIADNDGAGWAEMLIDNSMTPVPEQVHFRVEFPRWLAAQTQRNQQIVARLSRGYTTAEVASRFRISRGRVSQLRKEFYDSWNEFTGDI